ncbi:hypothetical protein N7528_000283 [Penicillium herquei]|nr:hypothetical protein N7528_000283 [Penicillium herquei]
MAVNLSMKAVNWRHCRLDVVMSILVLNLCKEGLSNLGSAIGHALIDGRRNPWIKECRDDTPNWASMCRSCAKGGYLCEVSATLRRNTKVRGFTSDEQRFVQLQEELARCQQLLQSEKAQNGALKSELSNSKQTISLLEKDLLNPRLAEQSSSRQNKSRQNKDPTYMIKHMGRLVHDEMGVGRFAGSTTGIHFVLTVEQQCQKVLNLSTGFPESCFRLFLAQTSPIRQNWITNVSTGEQSEILASFNNPLSYYLAQADRFINEWEAYCPVLVRKQLMSDVRHTMETLHVSLNFQDIDPAILLTLLVILIINELCLSSGQQISSHHRYLNMADTLINDIRARGDIKGLTIFGSL